MLRAALIRLSREERFGRAVERSTAGRALAARFVAGATHADAVRAAQRLNRAECGAALTLLGEEISEPAEADAAAQEYLDLIGAAATAGGDVRIAVKPSLLGLPIAFDAAQDRLTTLVDAAGSAGLWLEIDMEGSAAVDDTLALYRRAAERSALTAVAMQAYLRRTPEDVAGLVDEEIARVRLVKGAYSEPREIAWQDARRIRRAYRGALEQLTSTPAQASNGWVGVATHDARLHRAARRLMREREVPDAAWEFQMLYGVRPQLRQEMVEQGERVRISAPYGERWYPYFVRRIAERPANALFALRALAGV